MSAPEPNRKESVAPIDRPGGPDAVLLLHGLTSSPYELRPLADALAAAGLRVKAPRLIGHGTRVEQMRHTRWTDWLATARRAFDQLAEEHERVFVVGNSLGALLGIVLTHERGLRVAGLVAMSTPLELEWKSQLVLSLAARTPLADVLPFVDKDGGPDVSDSAVAAAMPSYDRVPLAAAASMLEGQREAADRARRLSVPVLVLHGRRDHTARVHNAHRLNQLLATRHKRVIIYPRSWHILPLDVEHDAVAADIVAFVRDPKSFTWNAPLAPAEACG